MSLTFSTSVGSHSNVTKFETTEVLSSLATSGNCEEYVSNFSENVNGGVSGGACSPTK